MDYEQAVEAYQDTKRRLGRVPYRKEIPAKASLEITKKYPNWFDFLKSQNDYDKSPSNRKMSRYISDAQMITEIREVYAKLGYPPHRKDYNRTTTAINHFGSWRKFLKKAGIKATYVGLSQFSKEEVIYNFKVFIEKNHKFPVTDQVSQTGVSIDTVLRLFGSLENLAHYFNCHTHRFNKAELKEKRVLEAAQMLKDRGLEINRYTVATVANLDKEQVSGVVARYKIVHGYKRLSFVEFMKIHGFKAVNQSPHKKVKKLKKG